MTFNNGNGTDSEIELEKNERKKIAPGRFRILIFPAAFVKEKDKCITDKSDQKV